jgi:guanylate kinase
MAMTQARGLFFVFVGPGGTGKNTLMNIMKERHPELQQLATATTRAMRLGEQQGRERLFVSEERFREMIANNELLEYQEVTQGRFYGMPRASVDNALDNGQNLVADIEVRGAKVLLEEYPDDAVIIYVTVSGDTEEEQLEKLKERMLQRLDHEPTEKDWKLINQRLKRALDLEFPFAKICENIIINDNLELAAEQVDKIIRQQIAERAGEVIEES